MIDYFTIIKTFLCLPTDLVFTFLPQSVYEKHLWIAENKSKNNEISDFTPPNSCKEFISKNNIPDQQMGVLLYYFGETIMSERLENFILSKNTNPSEINKELRLELKRYRPMKFFQHEYPIYFYLGSILGSICFWKLTQKFKGLFMICNVGNIGYFFGGNKFGDLPK